MTPQTHPRASEPDPSSYGAARPASPSAAPPADGIAAPLPASADPDAPPSAAQETESAPEGASVPPALVRLVAGFVLAWLAVVGVMAVVAGAGLHAVEKGGWRLFAYRDVSTAAFALTLIAAMAAAAAWEARRRMGRDRKR